MDNIKIECTWGEGPDILLSSEKSPILSLVPGENLQIITNWQLDLTKNQAIALKLELENAIRQVEDLDAVCTAHDQAKR